LNSWVRVTYGIINQYNQLIFCRPDEGYRIFNTWLGEPSKVQVLKKVIDIIKQDDLLKNVQVTGDMLLSGLKDFQVSNNTFHLAISVVIFLHSKTNLIKNNVKICVFLNFLE